MNKVTIFVDGAIAGSRQTGVAAICKSPTGHFVGWLSRQMKRMTNNEAEYQAVLLGLELAGQLGATKVEIVSDSEVVVRQMMGYSRVNSARLKKLHHETCQVVRHFQEVTFRNVGREQNKVADALAADALAGEIVKMPAANSGWERLLSLAGR
jgi:probable phosphoglycerate mutase